MQGRNFEEKKIEKDKRGKITRKFELNRANRMKFTFIINRSQYLCLTSQTSMMELKVCSLGYWQYLCEYNDEFRGDS